MSIQIDGQTYYRTQEVCIKTGISRSTLCRWLRTGVLKERLRDRRGWGVFTEKDIEKIRKEAQKIEVHFFAPENHKRRTGLTIKGSVPKIKTPVK